MRIPKFKYLTAYSNNDINYGTTHVSDKFAFYRLGELFRLAKEKNKRGVYYVLHFNTWHKFLFCGVWRYFGEVEYKYEQGLCIDRDRDLNRFGLVPSLTDKEWEKIRSNPSASKYWKDMAQANICFHYLRSQRMVAYKGNKLNNK